MTDLTYVDSATRLNWRLASPGARCGIGAYSTRRMCGEPAIVQTLGLALCRMHTSPEVKHGLGIRTFEDVFTFDPDGGPGFGDSPCSGCGRLPGSYVITTWAPVYVTVDAETGEVTRVRVNDEALDVAGLAVPDRRSYVTCGACDAPTDERTELAVKSAADDCSDWPGWELGI